MPDDGLLTRRALNRATLARQLLLERTAMAPYDAVHLLVGQQAQVPGDPYVGLWSRLSDFRPQELGKLVSDRELVRAGLMRGTIHLVAADDCLAMWPWIEPVLRRALNGSFGRFLRDVDTDEIAEAARALLDRAAPHAVRAEAVAVRPLARGRSDGPRRGRRLPRPYGADRAARRVGLDSAADAEHGAVVAGRPLDAAPDVDSIVLRYFAAYGPASVMDLQAWCGLTKLKEVVERLRPRLLSFRRRGRPRALRPARGAAPRRRDSGTGPVPSRVRQRAARPGRPEQVQARRRAADSSTSACAAMAACSSMASTPRCGASSGPTAPPRCWSSRSQRSSDDDTQAVLDEGARLLSFLTTGGEQQSVQLVERPR